MAVESPQPQPHPHPHRRGRAWSRRLARARRWAVGTVQVLGLGLIGGFLIGVGLTLADLSEFSRVPSSIGVVMPLVAGALIGALTRHLSYALIALMLTTAVSATVSTLALAYPEFEVGRLGVEIAVGLSVGKALSSSFLTLPIVAAGLLLSKLLLRLD